MMNFIFNIEITSSQVQQSMESGNLCYHRLERHVMSCRLVSCWAELRWSHHTKLHHTTLSSDIIHSRDKAVQQAQEIKFRIFYNPHLFIPFWLFKHFLQN